MLLVAPAVRASLAHTQWLLQHAAGTTATSQPQGDNTHSHARTHARTHTHTNTHRPAVREGLTLVVLWTLLVSAKHLDGGEALDLVAAAKALVLVSIHCPHLDHTLHGEWEGERGKGREGGVERGEERGEVGR